MLPRLLSPRLMRPLFWLLAAFALIMALLPKPPGLPIDSLGDKFAHMLAFSVLTGVAAFAWRKLSWSRIVVALSLFGAAIEVLQAIPALNRDSDWRDWVADTIAVVVTIGVARWLAQRLVPSAPGLD